MRGFIELISQRETEDNQELKIQIRVDAIITIEDYNGDETRLYIIANNQVDSIEVEEKYEDVVAKMENEVKILNAFQG